MMATREKGIRENNNLVDEFWGKLESTARAEKRADHYGTS